MSASFPRRKRISILSVQSDRSSPIACPTFASRWSRIGFINSLSTINTLPRWVSNRSSQRRPVAIANASP